MVIGNFAGLWESVHTFVYPGIEPPIITVLVQVVLVPDVVWYEVSLEPYVFWCWQWIVEVKVFNVDACGFSTWCGYDVVQKALDCDEICYFGGHITLKVDAVTSYGASDPVWVWLLLPIVGDNPNICCPLGLWDFLFVNKLACVGAGDRVVWVLWACIPIEEAPKFLAHC